MTIPIDTVELRRRLQVLVTHIQRAEDLVEDLLAATAVRPPTVRELARITAACGVPLGYLTGTPHAAAIVEAQLDLLSALRACDDVRWRTATSVYVGPGNRPMIGTPDEEDGPSGRAPTCTRTAWRWRTRSREADMGEDRSRSRHQLLRRCGDIVRELDDAVGGIPHPFELESFLSALSESRGDRPIEALPFPASQMPNGLCGLWVAYDDYDVIGYPAFATPTHRDHIICHEVGHMVAAHTGTMALGERALEALFPNLDPALVRAFLGRSVYSDREEQEAELIASLIMQRAWSTSRLRVARDSVAETVTHRLEQTFG